MMIKANVRGEFAQPTAALVAPHFTIFREKFIRAMSSQLTHR
jgi:hypothetical protein